jgi:hypothetical protein
VCIKMLCYAMRPVPLRLWSVPKHFNTLHFFTLQEVLHPTGRPFTVYYSVQRGPRYHILTLEKQKPQGV